MEFLPIGLMVVPLLFAGLVWIARQEARPFLFLLGTGVALMLSIYQLWEVLQGKVILGLGEEILVDALSAFMALLIAFLSFVCAIYSTAYLTLPHLKEASEERLRMFQTLFLVLEFTLFWTVMTNNIVLLWVALEATTLASALLVSFYWNKRALEAGYKYLLLLTVGITSALFGCVLLYAAAAPHLGDEPALLMTNIKTVIEKLPKHIALISAILLLIGFGTKAGLAPFHPWIPDAHAEAPTVMSAILSGIIIKVPLYAILRIMNLFAPEFPQLGTLILGIGVFSMLLGSLLAFLQEDLKRLLAYSSAAQIGYIAAGMGVISYLGYYGALLHIAHHALTKALLFMAGGIVAAMANTRQIPALGGIARKMPATSIFFLIGALSLGGVPLFSGFISKLTVILALTQARAWTSVVIAVSVSLLTLAYILRAFQRVFWGEPRSQEALNENIREAPLPMLLAMALLALGIFTVGIGAQLLDPILDLAAKP
ncbi:MAG: oxidoreductase [Armatimonadetes bacterium]|nr:oxidoreductase [Armatimonadota bacterium]MDW8029175.1 proton-conducting transporter membrane subunit [Armatimonadota bacterium]